MPPPPMHGILETVLYYPEDLEPGIHRFYQTVLGLRLISRKEGHHLFFRVESGVLLLFNPESSGSQGSPPPHGAAGPGHICFRVPASAYQSWQEHLAACGVEIEEELTWPGGGRSFYFRDPAGNALEIADGDIWAP